MRRAAAILSITIFSVWGGAVTAIGISPTLLHGSPDAPRLEKPRIVSRPIPFGKDRKREMARYSLRHYGTRTWRLTDPKVIVEHYTDGPTFSSAWNSFASNSPHLGELPGTCAHFIIDTDGTIYQLVDLGIRCRHVVGLNYTAIGIEHVGTSDAQILHDPAQMRSSLRLTLWLMAKYGIELRNVIGHAEALMSPYHHELVPSWRCLVHSDWQHPDMQIYRRKLKRRAERFAVPVGPRPQWVTPNC